MQSVNIHNPPLTEQAPNNNNTILLPIKRGGKRKVLINLRSELIQRSHGQKPAGRIGLIPLMLEKLDELLGEAMFEPNAPEAEGTKFCTMFADGLS